MLSRGNEVEQEHLTRQVNSDLEEIDLVCEHSGTPEHNQKLQNIEYSEQKAVQNEQIISILVLLILTGQLLINAGLHVCALQQLANIRKDLPWFGK